MIGTDPIPPFELAKPLLGSLNVVEDVA